MFLKLCGSVKHKELYSPSSALFGVHIHQQTQEFYEGDQDTPNNWQTQSQNRRIYNFKLYSQAHRASCICFCSFGSNIGQHFRSILLVFWNNPTKGKKIFISAEPGKNFKLSRFAVFLPVGFQMLATNRGRGKGHLHPSHKPWKSFKLGWKALGIQSNNYC